MHSHDHRRGKPTPSDARPVPAGPPGHARHHGTNEVLYLQRSVGNGVTSQFVQLARQAGELGEEPSGGRSSVHEVLGSRGQSLPADVRRIAEAGYGEDFSGVQVHRDALAVRSAKEFRARAYASGDHVVMPPGNDDLHTWLHELDHVRKQRRGVVAGTDRGDGVRVSDPSDEHEKEADANATRALQGHAAHVGHDHSQPGHGAAHPGGAPAVQRTPATWSYEPSVRAAERLQPGRPGIGQQQSFWPPIVALIQEYAGLSSPDTAGRTDVLDRLDRAIQAWEQNQGRRGIAVFNQSAAEQKRNVIRELRRVMDHERRQITALEEQEANPPRTPSPEGGAQAADTGRSTPEQSSSGDDESIGEIGPGRLMRTRARLENVEPLPPGVQIYAHFTEQENLYSIRAEGLRPGASKGIGLPEGGSDAYHTYVVSGSPDALPFVTSEAGEGVVGVIGSGVNPDRDANYGGGAYRFPGGMPPVRRAGRTEGGGPFSFTLPASAKERQGIHTFVNQVLAASDQEPITEREAYLRVLAHLMRRMPLNVADAASAALGEE
ncbi:eCIS core domain-containing protein [Actinosynnema sp. NPDC004786]